MTFNIYVSNKIGSEAVGVFGLVMSAYLFFVTLASSGLSLACTYLVSEQFAKSNYLNGLKAVKSCNLFAIVLGLTSSILVLLFSNVISQNWMQGKVSAIPFYLIAIGLPFIAVSSVLNGYFSAVQKAYKSAFAQLFELLIKIIISIILLTCTSLKSVEAVCTSLILADVISEIFSCLFLYVLYHFDKTKYYTRKIEKITFKKRILQITFPVCVTSYIRSGLSTLKQFIVPNRLIVYGLSYSLALSEYGKITGMALPLLMFPTVCIGSFSGLLIPEFVNLLAKNMKKRMIDICHKIFNISAFFSIAVSSIFIFYANELSLMIFQNLECANYIRILSPLIWFMYLDNIIDSMLKGLNKQFEVMIYNILDLIITITLLYFLLPVIGIKGFIISIYVSEIFNFSVSYFELYKITGFKMNIFDTILKPVIVCFSVVILSKIIF